MSSPVNILTADWPAPKGVRTLITQKNTRFELSENQISKSTRYGFNIATHVNDETEAVLRRRAMLSHHTGSELLWLSQTHSAEVVHFSKNLEAAEPSLLADASYTGSVGRVCIVSTADCLPILLCDQQARVVAAVHAGWQGLLNGVIENTITKIKKYLSETSDQKASLENVLEAANNFELLAYIGPSIRQSNYQVDSVFRKRFVNADERFENAFVREDVSGEEKYLASLSYIAKTILKDSGVNNIHDSELCSFDSDEQFYSHRRDPNTGRFASMIWLE